MPAIRHMRGFLVVMGNKDIIQITGIVVESLPGTTFRIRIEDGTEILGHLAGKMRIHYIRILPGDKVLLEVARLGDKRGRIVRRY